MADDCIPAVCASAAAARYRAAPTLFALVLGLDSAWMRLFELRRTVSATFGCLALALCCGCADDGPPPESSDSGAELVSSSHGFRDVTSSWGLTSPTGEIPAGTFAMPELMGPGCGLLDVHQDGDLDIVQVSCPLPGQPFDSPAPNRLHVQERVGQFTTPADALGLADAGYGQGVACADVNGDGATDVFFSNLGPDSLYTASGSKFENVTAEAGISSDEWSVASVFADVDRDGDLDLFVVNYVQFDPAVECRAHGGELDYCGPQSYESVTDVLLRNDGGKFTDVSAASGIQLAGAGLGVIAHDFDGDGWVDLYVANDAQVNHLWVNRRDGRFAEQAYLRGVGVNRLGKPEASMGVALGDVDGDRDLDFVLTHLKGENNTLYVADAGGLYRDATVDSGMTDADLGWTGFGCGLVDRDHDGDLDLLVVNGHIKRRERAIGTGLGAFWNAFAEPALCFDRVGARFESVPAGDFTQRIEVARGLALGDLDADGDVDCVTSGVGGTLRIYRNEAGGRNWLRVRALSGASDALGAVVTIGREDGSELVRPVVAAGSYSSSHDPSVHFGLAEDAAYEWIEVCWPTGSVERYDGGSSNRTVVVRRGEGVSR